MFGLGGEGEGGGVCKKVKLLTACYVSFLFHPGRDLSENDISVIPSEVFFKLRSLIHLNLGHSNITVLSNNSFRTLTNLKKL